MKHKIKGFDRRINQVKCTCGWVGYSNSSDWGRAEWARHRETEALLKWSDALNARKESE